MSPESIPGALDALTRRVGHLERALHFQADGVERRITAIETTVKETREAVAENTAITREAVQMARETKTLIEAGKLVHSAGKWLVGVVAFCLTMYATWKSLKP